MEFHERGIEHSTRSNWDVLENLLQNEMHSIHRLPALLTNDPLLLPSFLKHYEILPCEP